MPTYEYQCTTCNHRFEKYQSFSDEPLKTCPECGREVRKVFSAAGIIFKGSGWYVNDSRKTGKSETRPESSSDAKTEITAESKTETKGEKDEAVKPADAKGVEPKVSETKPDASKQIESKPAENKKKDAAA